MGERDRGRERARDRVGERRERGREQKGVRLSHLLSAHQGNILTHQNNIRTWKPNRCLNSILLYHRNFSAFLNPSSKCIPLKEIQEQGY